MSRSRASRLKKQQMVKTMKTMSSMSISCKRYKQIVSRCQRLIEINQISLKMRTITPLFKLRTQNKYVNRVGSKQGLSKRTMKLAKQTLSNTTCRGTMSSWEPPPSQTIINTSSKETFQSMPGCAMTPFLRLLWSRIRWPRTATYLIRFTCSPIEQTSSC